MNRYSQRLFKTDSVDSLNQDIKIGVNLVSNYRELPDDEITEVVNAYEVFNEERNNSYKYRLIGTVRVLASNPLLDISGNDSLVIFDNNVFRNQNPLDESIIDVTDSTDYTYEQSYKVHFKELDGWFGYYDPNLASTSKCKFIDLSPKRESFNIIDSGNTNWYFCMTYPYDIDDTHVLVNGGLLIVDTGSALIGGAQKMILITAVKHNLVAGDKIRLSNTGSFDGYYDVIRLGYDNGDLREYAFVIDLDAGSFVVGSGVYARITKIYYGEPSVYYFRKFRRITEVNNYDAYNIAYSQNIYGDKISQIVFHGGSGNTIDIELGEYRDNLGRPLSEIYITAIKGKFYMSGQKSFSDIKSGIDIPFIGGVSNYLHVPDIRRIHNVATHPIQSHYPLESNITHSDLIFYGDVVEYNKFLLKEYVLAEVNHRFNTTNRDITIQPSLPNSSNFVMGPRPEGYMYKPHHRIEIRRFSSYIERGDSSVVGIPDYATLLNNNQYIWRDLLSLGFNDGGYETALDYPFLNGAHYIHTNILLNVRRQDPFNQYGLYYGNFPRDPFGDRVDLNNFNGKVGENAC